MDGLGFTKWGLDSCLVLNREVEFRLLGLGFLCIFVKPKCHICEKQEGVVTL